MAWMQRLAATATILVVTAACGEAPPPDSEGGTGTEAGAESGESAGVAGDQDGETLVPIDRSGIRGSASLSLDDEEAEVDVVVRGISPGQRYSANVHSGRCSGGGVPILPLGDLTAGDDSVASTRTRVASSAFPPGQEVFVQVYDDAGEPVACADMPTVGGDSAPDDSAGDVR
jgi:hypothetical protein